ncbi:MAG TPA: hypothetical protein VFG66_09595 [Gemmatimonadales bacterium]|nr:hypothetical protein [Gemmatimonadales bacterium]
MRPFAVLVPLALLTTHAAPHAAPKTGEDLVRQMHARYAGKWYRTITFVQTTSHPDRPTETWYEAGTIPGKLRIDVAPTDSMKAIMFVGDSTIVFRGGKRVGAQRGRNLLMTLGFDVYGQSPDTTIAQLEAEGIDLSRLHEARWHGTKVWVVGADRGDTTTSQFWIEQDRLLFVRLIEVRNDPQQPQAPSHLLDVTFEQYQPLGKGWVAPAVVIKVNGKEVQREEYREIRADVPLQADLYDTRTYRKAEWIEGR